LQRHSLVLDVNAATGLLTWEALRRAPAGGVWALTSDAQAAAALQQQAERLPEVERPIVMLGDVIHLTDLLTARGDQVAAGRSQGAAGHSQEEVRFDAVVGRNALTRCTDKAAALAQMRAWLRGGGRLSLAEAVPRQAQRPSALVDLTELGSDLIGRLQAAEDAIYQTPDDPLVNWDLPDLAAALQAAGLRLHTALAYETHTEERRLTAAHLARWFTVSASPGRPTYASRLRACLSATELQRVEACFHRQLLDQIVPWRTTLVYVVAS